MKYRKINIEKCIVQLPILWKYSEINKEWKNKDVNIHIDNEIS